MVHVKHLSINVIKKLIKEGKIFVYDFKITEHFSVNVEAQQNKTNVIRSDA